ncbi:myelin protein zero-like 1 like [Pimephales promelas]|uniref:myelin protein zero-like 1 like n=1 Tax=Pimephales promelas TaxID=90988 RepID=UPI001955CFEC|nr:myelin protein zero-like 1 like [Pimephales promelas]KAG1927540.1 myelin protein zero-like protein [Pimephales promelas]
MEIRLPISTHSYVSLCVFVVFIIAGVPAIDVFTPAEVFVENGTTATLSCSFKSKEVVGSAASVTWYFLAEGDTGQPTSIFYHAGGRPFPGSLPQFKSRVEWAGDMNKKDASIRVIQMQFKDNGTFSCDVKNPPDITGQMSVTKVRVVMREALPHTSAAVIVGGVIGAVIGIIIISVVTYLIIRRQEPTHDYEGCTSLESVSSQNTRVGKKAESSNDNSRCSSPSAPVQGPVIYAQLDHSGSKNSSIHKMEPVVYADIRKN